MSVADSYQPTPRPAVECPRCGYDLRGNVTQWRTENPERGTCPECGLELLWRDIIDPRRSTPKWFIEHSFQRSARNYVFTWVRALRPGIFWRRVRIEHPILPRRVIIFALLTILACYFLAGAAGIAAGFANKSFSFSWPVGSGGWTQWVEYVVVMVWPLTPTIQYNGGYPDEFGWLVLLWAWLMPLGFIMLGDSFRIAKVRKIHLLRGAAYSWAAAPIILAVTMALTVIDYTTAWGRGWPPSAMDRILISIGSARWILAPTIMGVYLAWFWTMYTRRYLRLPDTAVVIFFMMVVSLLGAIIVCAYWPASNLSTYLVWRRTMVW